MGLCKLVSLGALCVLSIPSVSAHAADRRFLARWQLTEAELRDMDGYQLAAKWREHHVAPACDQAAMLGDTVELVLTTAAFVHPLTGNADYRQAYRCAALAAKLGEPRAMSTAGSLMASGVGAPRDEQAGIALVQRAADAGVPIAISNIGLGYLEGLFGLPKDVERGHALTNRAVATGNGDVLYAVGTRYYYGATGLAKDLAKAFSLFSQAAQAGNTESMYWAAMMMDEKAANPAPVDREAQADYLRRAAELGYGDAEYTYGDMLARGTDTVEKDPAGALIYLRRASDHGRTGATFALAFLLLDAPTGITRDYAQSEQLFRAYIAYKDAEPGYIQAAWYNLGLIKEQTSGPVAARPLFEKSAALGLPAAKTALAALDRQAAKAAARWAAAAASAKVQAASYDAAEGPAGSPRPSQIAQLLALESARYLGGQPTANAGEIAYPSPFGGIQHYVRYSVSNVRCNASKTGVYHCGFHEDRRLVGAPDSFWGAMYEVGAAVNGENWSQESSYNFTKGKSGAWSSPALDAAYRKFAIERRAARQQNGSRWTYQPSETTQPNSNGGIPDFSGTMCNLGSTSYC